MIPNKAFTLKGLLMAHILACRGRKSPCLFSNGDNGRLKLRYANSKAPVLCVSVCACVLTHWAGMVLWEERRWKEIGWKKIYKRNCSYFLPDIRLYAYVEYNILFIHFPAAICFSVRTLVQQSFVHFVSFVDKVICSHLLWNQSVITPHKEKPTKSFALVGLKTTDKNVNVWNHPGTEQRGSCCRCDWTVCDTHLSVAVGFHEFAERRVPFDLELYHRAILTCDL